MLGDFEEDLINEEEPSEGVKLIIKHGDDYEDKEDTKYEVEFKIKCIE